MDKCFVCDGKKIDFGLDENYLVCSGCGLIARKPVSRAIPCNDVTTRSTDDVERIEKGREAVYRDMLHKVERGKPLKGRILDVGCGSGGFLVLAKNRGWECFGVEPAAQPAKNAKDKGLNVSCCPLEKDKFPENYFDAVTMVNTLDFVADPIYVLTEINRSLKQEGMLLLRLPNAGTQVFLRYIHRVMYLQGQKKIGEFFNFGFTPKSIRMILWRTGFKNVRIYISPIVQEDVYGHRLPLMSFFKRTYDLLSRAVYSLSFRKLCVSTSVYVIAVK